MQARVLWTEKSATYNNLAGNHVWEWCGRLGMECVWTSGQKCVLGKIAFWAKVILGKSASGQKCVWAKVRLGKTRIWNFDSETGFNYDRTPPGRTSGEERAEGGCKIVSFFWPPALCI